MRDITEQITFDQLMGINPEYDSFVAKFKPKKTTDDCYTPPLVFDAVADWVAREYGVEKARFVRPFFPGGNYETFPYQPGEIVVDNPPFSIMSKIVRHYDKQGIPFFLFGPSLTLFNSGVMSVTYIPADCDITYENGAVVRTGFITNLDTCLVRSAPDLYVAVKAAMAETLKETKTRIPKYSYPDNVVTSAMVQRYSKYGIEYRLERDAAVFISALDMQKEQGKTVFGGGFLTGERAAAERAAAERAAAERAAAERAAAERAAATRWVLSDREKEIVRKLGEGKDEGNAE